MEEKKTELEEDLDRSLKHALRHRKDGKNLHYIPHNCEIGAKTGDDVQTFVRQWAEKNDVHLFVLDWGKLECICLCLIGVSWIWIISTIMKTDSSKTCLLRKRSCIWRTLQELNLKSVILFQMCIEIAWQAVFANLRRIFFLQSQRTIRIFRKNNFIAWIVQNPRVLVWAYRFFDG